MLDKKVRDSVMTFKDILESEENSEQEWVPDNGTGVEFEDYSITEPFDPTHIRVDTKQITIDLLL